MLYFVSRKILFYPPPLKYYLISVTALIKFDIIMAKNAKKLNNFLLNLTNCKIYLPKHVVCLNSNFNWQKAYGKGW